ncbi:response regulator transcription factor [Herpetosiphon llansteffanensis]|uniref:response regulator transcription factor n=1 Tax=Herpetosiphon llansteffanensis TaxID=2094568 RepID=UPI000D7CFAF2|nr:helix-turn-helix transcriptional regulator [Herpetosiphon llansteffanensis]
MRLSQRQWQVIDCVAQGQTNSQIAVSLCISVATVEKHLTIIFKRLAINNRTSLAQWYWGQQQLVPHEPR